MNLLGANYFCLELFSLVFSVGMKMMLWKWKVKTYDHVHATFWNLKMWKKASWLWLITIMMTQMCVVSGMTVSSAENETPEQQRNFMLLSTLGEMLCPLLFLHFFFFSNLRNRLSYVHLESYALHYYNLWLYSVYMSMIDSPYNLFMFRLLF